MKQLRFVHWLEGKEIIIIVSFFGFQLLCGTYSIFEPSYLRCSDQLRI